MENNNVSTDKSFSVWSKCAHEQHPEIIQSWIESTDPFKRAMAKTILQAAGVGDID